MQVPSAIEDTFCLVSLVIFASRKENNNDRSLGKYYNIFLKSQENVYFYITNKQSRDFWKCQNLYFFLCSIPCQ